MTDDRENPGRRDEVPDRAELARGHAPTADQRRAETDGVTRESGTGPEPAAGDETAGVKPTVQQVRTARSPDPGRSVMDPDPDHQAKRPGRMRNSMLGLFAVVALIVLVALLF